MTRICGTHLPGPCRYQRCSPGPTCSSERGLYQHPTHRPRACDPLTLLWHNATLPSHQVDLLNPAPWKPTVAPSLRPDWLATLCSARDWLTRHNSSLWLPRTIVLCLAPGLKPHSCTGVPNLVAFPSSPAPRLLCLFLQLSLTSLSFTGNLAQSGLSAKPSVGTVWPRQRLGWLLMWRRCCVRLCSALATGSAMGVDVNEHGMDVNKYGCQ